MGAHTHSSIDPLRLKGVSVHRRTASDPDEGLTREGRIRGDITANPYRLDKDGTAETVPQHIGRPSSQDYVRLSSFLFP